MQQDNQKQTGNKSSDQLRKPMEAQANKPATEGQVPPTTDYNQEKHWADKGQRSQVQANQQPQQKAGIQQQYQNQQNTGDVKANQAQETAQDNQQTQQNQPKQRQSSRQMGEDRSKSFGESAVPAGGEVDHSDDDGVIPKENSFPNYNNPAGQAKGQVKDKQDYTH